MKRKHLGLIITSAVITSAITVGVIYYFARKNKMNTRMARVADEGYETAEDILYPLRHNRKRS
jgi:hypothetical protein